jgi:hypothetical protein
MSILLGWVVRGRPFKQDTSALPRPPHLSGRPSLAHAAPAAHATRPFLLPPLRASSSYREAVSFNSTFGGAEGFGNACSNGGGISSIGVSWQIINSHFSHNRATGNGGNPSQPGTPGGGSGGAIYNDGNTMTLSLCGTLSEHNEVVQHGSAIFFVSNDRSGDVRIDGSIITNNVGGLWYPTYPQISGHEETPIVVTDSTIE